MMNVESYAGAYKYGQRGLCGGLMLCKILDCNSNNLGLLIKGLSKKFSMPLFLDECIVDDISNVYTIECISKEVKERGQRSYQIYSNREIESNKELYKRSLFLIGKHCNDLIVNDEWLFYLELFQASLSRHLDEVDMAKYHNDVAWEIFDKEGRSWGQEVDLDRKEKRLEKYGAITRGSILCLKNKATFTFEEALLSKSFVVDENMENPMDAQTCRSSVIGIREHIGRLRKTEFSKKIMEVNALNALYNKRFNILFVNKNYQDTPGYMQTN